ncbi:hypothetical protein PESP_a2240 [Pseudoalteromonas espejiana DSM 9414]|nr:hypothetical protein PESP_a2240 [Pseudoalteromonas espejiana DSM 9414]
MRGLLDQGKKVNRDGFLRPEKKGNLNKKCVQAIYIKIIYT